MLILQAYAEIELRFMYRASNILGLTKISLSNIEIPIIKFFTISAGIS